MFVGEGKVAGVASVISSDPFADHAIPSEDPLQDTSPDCNSRSASPLILSLSSVTTNSLWGRCLFFAHDPSQEFQMRIANLPIHQQDASTGFYCLETKSLQLLPRQCRRVSFVHRDSSGSFKLAFIYELDHNEDALSFVHILPATIRFSDNSRLLRSLQHIDTVATAGTAAAA